MGHARNDTRRVEIAALGIALGYLLWGFWERWDLPLYDGVYYFRLAAGWPLGQLRLPGEWSPLYVVSYAPFHWVFGGLGPFWVYALHRLAVLAAVGFLVRSLARRHWGAKTSCLLAVAAVANQALLENFHVVHAAGLLWVLVTLRLAVGRGFDGALAAALALAGVFVRPEFLAAALLLLAYLTWSRWRGIPGSGGRLRKAGLAALLALGMWALSDSPRQGAGRAFEAFAQQSAWAERGETSVAAGFLHRERASAIYGDADTLWEAALANPGAFSETVAYNLRRLPGALWKTLPPVSPLPLLSGLLLTIALAAALAGEAPGEPPGRGIWAVTGAFALAGAAASVLIRPTPLYLLPALPLILFGAARLAAGAIPKAPGRQALWTMVFGAATASLLWLAGWAAPPPGQPILEFSRRLASHPGADAGLRVLAYSPESYCLWPAHLGMDCSGVGPASLASAGTLGEVFQREEIEAVVVDAALRQAARELELDWAAFESQPSSFGFRLAAEATGGVMGQLLDGVSVETASRLYRRE